MALLRTHAIFIFAAAILLGHSTHSADGLNYALLQAASESPKLRALVGGMCIDNADANGGRWVLKKQGGVSNETHQSHNF